jgi:ParB-like chromosome segregation protein Spo0J
MSTEKTSIPEVQDATQGKYYKVDFRTIRPLDLAGGNQRDDYPKIPELAEDILFTGSIDGVRFSELVADITELFSVNRAAWTAEVRKRFAGKFHEGGINTPLVGYRKIVDGTHLNFTLAGHRRTKACEMIFKEYGIVVVVPFVPKDVRGLSDVDILSFILNENNNRVELDVVEQARVAKRMLDLGTTIPEIAIRFNNSKHYQFVKDLLRLDAAPDTVKKLVREKQLPYTAFLELSRKSKDEAELLSNLDRVVSNVSIAGKKKIKTRDVTKVTGTVNSSIEIKLFFSKIGDKVPEFKSKEDAILFDALKTVYKNQVTFVELEKQFFPQ